MKRNIFKITFLLGAMLIFSTSCDKTLDINTSPNAPATSTTAFTLPVAQASLTYMLNLDLGIMAGYLSQYWTQAYQAAQYQVYDNYTYNGNSTQTAWLHGYAWALEDLKFVKEKAVEDGTPNYEAIAEILTAYTYQVLTDVWDKVPYTEALQGKDGNLFPSYDDGDLIYDGIITTLDDALAKIDANSITPGADDLIFGGDMNAWIRFANTLKLRIYIRQIDARPSVSQTGIQTLISSGAEFLGPDEDAFVPYAGGSYNENPLYSGDVTTTGTGLGGVNINGSATIIDMLNANADPRISFYFDAATTGAQVGQYIGITQGEGVLQASGTPIGNSSVPSSVNVVAPTSPVYLMTGFESMFLQAEIAIRGLGGNAANLYDEAVLAAFSFTGNNGSAFVTTGGKYEFPNGTMQENLDAMATQKWLAMCGVMNVEAWAEVRRFDYLNFNQSVAGTGASLNGSMFPMRALYPVSEISTNPNAEPNGNIGDKVWWNQ
ncbi:MAG: SusD/RagB family nutrient-binding outer membrane lipoprotein [Cyclobacteriaceae bacterium]|nr:SusD/RagB family nutrient-binding outer membrane lipoprotein [Cyclobacteriaceae bacterium]